MHFAADALPACSPLSSDRLSEKVEIVAKIRKYTISHYCDHFLAHVFSREPQCASPRRRRRLVGDAGLFWCSSAPGLFGHSKRETAGAMAKEFNIGSF